MSNKPSPSSGPPPPEPDWLAWFDDLAELPLPERASRLAALAAERPDLAARLARLFAAEEAAHPALERPLLELAPELVAAALSAAGSTRIEVPRKDPAAGEPTAAEPTAPRPVPGRPGAELPAGTRIGAYRLLSLLGRGGMGEVYLAERADGVFEQRVALKLVKRGMDSDEILRRFQREREILARLEHPGIARILDGGTAPDGRPFFVLERVAGEPILEWCRRRRLPLEARLRLVIAACEAVDAAHRSLVVHRDLKPSNLLITAEGQAKLLDFGIAKVLREDSGSWATQLERRALTPAYAAPEQILGEPVTTAADVYALGVILFELLTGRTPHAREGPLAALAGGVEKETIERPSTVLRRAAQEREVQELGIPEPRRFARRLTGDLDTIVAKALRRVPARRYRSAADLAADLDRYLAGRPIEARAESALYRLGKFARRHKLAAAALAAVVLSLVVGFAVAVRQAQLARAQASRAERVKELLISIFREADPGRGSGEPITAQEILAAGSRRVRSELDSEPEVRAELLDAVAQIERYLGLLDAAKSDAERALAERRALFGADSPEAGLSLTTLAEVLLDRGSLDEALAATAEAQAALAGRFGAASDEGMRLAWIRGLVLVEKGAHEEALARAQEVTEATRRRFGERSIETARRLVELAGMHANLSRFDEAERLTNEALSILESSPAARLEAALARRMLAELLDLQSRDEEAARHYVAVLALQREALGARHLEVALTLIKYGFLLSELGRNPEAERSLTEAIEILRPLDHYETGAALRYLGFCLMSEERYAEAEERFLEAERFLVRKVGGDHPLTWAARLSTGWARLRAGKLAEAERTLAEVIAFYEGSVGPESYEIRSALKYLGEVRRERGDPRGALALHRRALAIEVKLFDTSEHGAVAWSSYQIALDLLAAGAGDGLPEARERIDSAVSYLRTTEAGRRRLDEVLLASGRIALAAGALPRARRDLEEALALALSRRGPDHPLARESRALLLSAQ